MKKKSLPFLAQSCIFLHTLLIGCSWLTLNYMLIFAQRRAISGVSVAMFLPLLLLVLVDALLVPSLFTVMYVFFNRVGRASRSPLWQDIMSGYALPIALLLTAGTCVFVAASLSSVGELLLLFPVFLWFMLKALGAPLAAWTISRKAFCVALIPAVLTIAAYVFFGIASAKGSTRLSPETIIHAHAIFFLVDYILSLWLYVLLAKLTRKEFYSPVLQTLWAVFLLSWILSFAASYYSDLTLSRERKQLALTWGSPLTGSGLRDVYYNGHEADLAFAQHLQDCVANTPPQSSHLIAMTQSLTATPAVNRDVILAMEEALATDAEFLDLMDQRLASNQILKFPMDSDGSDAPPALPYLTSLQRWSSLLPARVLCAIFHQNPNEIMRLWRCAQALHLSLSEEPFYASLQTNLQCLHYASNAFAMALSAGALGPKDLDQLALDLQLSRASLQKQLPLMRYGETVLLDTAFENIIRGTRDLAALPYNILLLRPLLAPLFCYLRQQQQGALTLFLQEDFTHTPLISNDWGVPALLPSMKMLQPAVQTASAKYQLLTAAVALERHLQQHGSVPHTLDELVPAFLTTLPKDPFGDQPMHYAVTDAPLAIIAFTATPSPDDDQTSNSRPKPAPNTTDTDTDTLPPSKPSQWRAMTTRESRRAAHIWSVGRNLVDNIGTAGKDNAGDDLRYTRFAPNPKSP